MDICIWDKCNNNCLMCTNPDWPWEDSGDARGGGYGFDALVSRIKEFGKKIKPSEAIILTGGETTLHPKFLDILEFVRKSFPENEIRILTNGRSFYYKDFAKKVLETKNLNLAISLYGPTPEIHDAITRTKNSFEQSVKGIENVLSLRDNDHSVEIRSVISKLSYKYLGEFLSLVNLKFPSIDRVILIFMEMEGQALRHKKAVDLKYSEAKPYIEKIIPFFGLLKEVRLYHFPLCSIDPKIWPFVWRTLPDSEVTNIEACEKCNYKKYCLGIHKEYLKNIGDKEFKSIEENFIIKETNNFHHPIEGIEI